MAGRAVDEQAWLGLPSGYEHKFFFEPYWCIHRCICAQTYLVSYSSEELFLNYLKLYLFCVYVYVRTHPCMQRSGDNLGSHFSQVLNSLSGLGASA